jgi:Zn-dependent peptidase ImmA (M78 family)
LQAPERDFALARVERDALPAFCDPEWQAWALAGAILVPRKSVAMLSGRSPQIVAETYRVSEKLAAVRLRRLGYQQETSALAGAVATEEG